MRARTAASAASRFAALLDPVGLVGLGLPLSLPNAGSLDGRGALDLVGA